MLIFPLVQAATPQFREYQQRVVVNARVLAESLMSLGYNIASGGTEIHLLLLDLRSTGIEGAGAKVERILELVAISTNKNTVPGDKSALNPSGLRLGTPALTSRQMGEEEMKRTAGFIDEAIKISSDICQQLKEAGKKDTVKVFKEFVESDEETKKRITELRGRVEQFAEKYPMPGLSDR